jgi:hypothetical protein
MGYITNSMESSPWEAKSRSFTQEEWLQDPATGPYPKSDESSPYHPIPF